MEYEPKEYALDNLFEARALWKKEGYIITPKGTSVGEVAINKAIDEYNEITQDEKNNTSPLR